MFINSQFYFVFFFTKTAAGVVRGGDLTKMKKTSGEVTTLTASTFGKYKLLINHQDDGGRQYFQHLYERKAIEMEN